MAYLIKITESKVEKLADKAGKALRCMGELMTCIDEMQKGSEQEEMNERNYMGDYRDYAFRDGGMREHSGSDRAFVDYRRGRY